ncbi:MAG: hypothetical protein D6724_05080 [Armatimonadetes bacterium]|nr:MAG: hypothetical protein D6724_05080 [Armatimonadota bacterium]GIV02702.1 MAG: hypothetical protein KatS3mg015_1532 [Fimbriimonadales bacterium]
MSEWFDPMTLAAMIVTLGIGGIVGALANAALAGRRVRDAFLRFEAAFRNYVADRQDEQTTQLRDLFDDLQGAITTADSALENLQRAFKPKRKK